MKNIKNPKQRLIIYWRDTKDALGNGAILKTEGYFCKSIKGAFKIISKQRKDNIKKAVFYNEYGEPSMTFRGKRKITVTPTKETTSQVAPTILWARLIKFFNNLLK